MWTDLSSVLSQCTDRRTDRILIAIPRLHYMQRGKNEALSSCEWPDRMHNPQCRHVKLVCWFRPRDILLLIFVHQNFDTHHLQTIFIFISKFSNHNSFFACWILPSLSSVWMRIIFVILPIWHTQIELWFRRIIREQFTIGITQNGVRPIDSWYLTDL